MKWSWKIARLAGIDVFMHWTFLLLLAWIGISYFVRGSNVAEALSGVAFILAIFACVVLHELGHALTARKFGIETRDITLLPIGGVARLERMPEDPKQELWVALAGPAVNVVIAAALLGYLTLVSGFTGQVPTTLIGGSFLVNLLWVNVLLVVFNLLPAFPMDGGRVLRALLATRLDYVRATEIAANVGQAMAILFGIVGLFGNPFLLFIALFVYLGAEGEARSVQMKSVLAGVPVVDAMMTRFRTLQVQDNLRRAVDELLAGHQQDFPVVDGQKLIGMLRRQRMVEALAEAGEMATVGRYAEPTCTVGPRDMLERLSAQMHEHGVSTVPVMDEGKLVGLVSTDNVGELLMVRSALQRDDSKHDPTPPVNPADYRHDAA